MSLLFLKILKIILERWFFPYVPDKAIYNAIVKVVVANIGYEGQYHVRIVNQDIKTKDDDTSQNNTIEPLNVQTGQEDKVTATDTAENSSTATTKDASDKADVIEPESDVVKDADSSVDKDVQNDVDHLSDMSDNTHPISMISKKWILKLLKTLIRVLIIALNDI